MNVATLLRLTAALEGATAAALLILPALMLWALFGQASDAPFSPLLARLFGASLFSLSLMCWGAGDEAGGRAALSHVLAMLSYNSLVAALLAYAGAILRYVGVGLWPAVSAHTLLAVWCVLALARGWGRMINSGASETGGRPR